jgi:serine/threonine protein phosphatase PrpC
MYISAKYIDIKSKQDYSDFICDKNYKSLVICDGIGEFSNSEIVAKTVVDVLITNRITDLNELFNNSEIHKLKESNVIGGTTILMAYLMNNKNIKIEYLGNGGCIHMYGNFASNLNDLLPYRYNHLINPHISPIGALTRHLSNNSGKNELQKSEITLNLNSNLGDILILFTDGINSLEENIIIKDNEGRYWRNESSAIQFIIEKLDYFLEKNYKSKDFQENLAFFNKSILDELKQQNFLEDDATLAFIITEETLNYYQTKND